ncbi:hypothetical protein TRAPUB_6629 [Trametes pubescens]|uniref:Uncharacterized protein n=1 Tax=Trametes pubescens TaxID=154538 RepID=A0A1M2V5B9_TRAPU|nr:hypothetical protein TRAPUB_6629 [Trametes pubescens]
MAASPRWSRKADSGLCCTPQGLTITRLQRVATKGVIGLPPGGSILHAIVGMALLSKNGFNDPPNVPGPLLGFG